MIVLRIVVSLLLVTLMVVFGIYFRTTILPQYETNLALAQVNGSGGEVNQMLFTRQVLETLELLMYVGLGGAMISVWVESLMRHLSTSKKEKSQ